MATHPLPEDSGSPMPGETASGPSSSRHIFALTIGQFFALFIIAAILGGLTVLGAGEWTVRPDHIAGYAERFVLPGFQIFAAGLAKASGLAIIGALPLLPIWAGTRLLGAYFRHRHAKRSASTPDA